MSIYMKEYYNSWKQKREIEFSFWKQWIETRGMEWPDDFSKRLDPKTTADNVINSLISKKIESPKILDAGSGPLSDFPKQLQDGRKPIITAIDALADQYNETLTKNGINPLVQVHQQHIETIQQAFPPNHFDFIYIRNTLDHTYNPFDCIENMLSIIKENAYIFLAHRTNLAARENYQGSSLWNLSAEKTDFIIWNYNRTINVSRELASIADTTLIMHENWIDITIQKKKIT